jgi:hypothetical protein
VPPRARLGAAAREVALRFGSERMVQRYHELYMRLAEGSRRTGGDGAREGARAASRR